MIKFNNKEIKNVRANNFNIIEMKFNNNIIYKNNPYLKLIYGDKFYDNDKIRYIPSYKFLDSNIIRYSYDAELIELNDNGLKSISSSSNFSENNIKNNIYNYSVDSKVLAWLNNNTLNIEILDETNNTIIKNLNQTIDNITDPFYIQISPKNDLIVILGNYVLSDTTNNYYKCDIYIYNLDTTTGAITSATMYDNIHTISNHLSSDFKDREGYKLYFNYDNRRNSGYTYRSIFFVDDLEISTVDSSTTYKKWFNCIFLKNTMWYVGTTYNYFNIAANSSKGNSICLSFEKFSNSNEQLNKAYPYYSSSNYDYGELSSYFMPQAKLLSKDGYYGVVELYRKSTSSNYSTLFLYNLNNNNWNNMYTNISISKFKNYGARIYNDINFSKFLLVNEDMSYYFLRGGNISSNAFSKTYTFDTQLNNVIGATFKEDYLYILDYKDSEYFIKVYKLDETNSIYNLLQTINLDASGTYNGITGGDFRLGTNNALIQTKDYIIVQFNTLNGTNNVYNFYQFKPNLK